MKKLIFIFFFLFLTPAAFHAFAGTTSLVTWYPPPTGSYNQVNLSSNYTSPLVTNSLACPNSTTVYLDSTTKALYQCTGVGTSTLYCLNPANSGTIIADNTGTLHVCNGTTDTIYPAECTNIFCSYDKLAFPAGTATCSTANLPACPAGFSLLTPINGALSYDQFQTSSNTMVISIVCCN
jgi:hypothetical protein